MDNKIDFEQYVVDATKTESIKEQILYNKDGFLSILKIALAATNINDFMKKGIYYSKNIEAEKFNQNLDSLIEEAQKLKELVKNNEINSKKEEINFNSRVLHAGLGIFTEGGEIIEAILKAQTEPIDLVNILEEIGDVSWYEAILLDELDGNLKKILEVNIAKLKKRYPEKFQEHHANNRDLDAEREILKKAAE